MKKLFLIATSLLIVFASPFAAAADNYKVGTVNYSQINKETNFSSKMRSAYQAKLKGFYKPIIDARKQLTAEKKRLDDTNAKLSKAQKVALQAKIKQQEAALTKSQQDLRKESGDFRAQVVSEFQDILSHTVRDIAKQQSINVVFQKSSVIYSDNTIDITKQVIAKLKKNKMLNAIKVSPAGTGLTRPSVH